MVLDEATLDKFLENPTRFLPGTRMGYAGIKDAQERAYAMQMQMRKGIKQVLGAGATGIVYLAKDRTLRRKVAIKILSPSLALVTADQRQWLALAVYVVIVSNP